MVFYVPPHKLLRVLADMQDVMGGERRCCVARELTKVHETFLRGPLHDVRRHVEDNGVRGEVTLLVEGSKAVSSATGRRPAPLTVCSFSARNSGKHGEVVVYAACLWQPWQVCLSILVKCGCHRSCAVAGRGL